MNFTHQLYPQSLEAGDSYQSLAAAVQATKNRLHTMSDNDIICSLDEQGSIIAISPNCFNMLGYSQAELVGRDIRQILPTSEAVAVFFNDASKNDLSFRFESFMQHRCGNRIAVEWSGFHREEEKAIYCSVKDITRRKDLERLNQESITMVAHDLRAPLTSLKVNIDVFESCYRTELNKAGQAAVESMRSILDRVISMVNDLLTLERIEAGMQDLTCNEVTFGKIAYRVVETLSALADKKNLNIEVSNPNLILHCDEDQIERVITNILSNAIKFSPKNETIKIEAKYSDDQIEVAFIDRGRGVPANKKKVIFEKYEQVLSEDAQGGNCSGLGLAICRAIIHAHDGQIGVDDTPGKGSKFWFRIPHNKEALY